MSRLQGSLLRPWPPGGLTLHTGGAIEHRHVPTAVSWAARHTGHPVLPVSAVRLGSTSWDTPSCVWDDGPSHTGHRARKWDLS